MQMLCHLSSVLAAVTMTSFICPWLAQLTQIIMTDLAQGALPSIEYVTYVHDAHRLCDRGG